ncbi:MAG: hypothetical protein PHE24_06200 [Patescibacteria group bacterium]|nr:hypothetical protein [Patescibacteria group bacterium]
MEEQTQTTKTIMIDKQHAVEEIMADLAVYQDPQMLLEKYSRLINVSRVDRKIIKRYIELFSNVRYFWQKTLKYVLYFEEFYPSTEKIEKFEALNHHIHAYLQDMTILKNKIKVLLDKIKNDIKKIATNKNEINIFFKAGVDKTEEVFTEVSKNRNPHHHQGMRFFDGDLLKAENAHEALKIFLNPAFNAILNQERKPELLAKFEKRKEESFEAGRKHWIEMARGNNEQISGYLDTLFKWIRPSLYKFLNIKPIKEILAPAESSKRGS